MRTDDVTACCWNLNPNGTYTGSNDLIIVLKQLLYPRSLLQFVEDSLSDPDGEDNKLFLMYQKKKNAFLNFYFPQELYARSY